MHLYMYKFIIFVIVVLSLITIGGYVFIQSMMPKQDTLLGTVFYNERIALLPGSVLTVSLRDVTASTETPVVLATYEYTTAGENIPLPYTLTYNPHDISRKGKYALYAEIAVSGEVRWVTNEPVPVLTGARPAEGIDVLVVAVPESESETTGTVSTAGLDGTNWVWQETTQGSESTRPDGDDFVLSFTQNSVMSTTDCNSLSGTYIINSDKIQFSPFASTLMFCEASNEAEYASALSSAKTFTKDGGVLTFSLEGGGTMIFRETTPDMLEPDEPMSDDQATTSEADETATTTTTE
jgi:putative lipoprotein